MFEPKVPWQTPIHLHDAFVAVVFGVETYDLELEWEIWNTSHPERLLGAVRNAAVWSITNFCQSAVTELDCVIKVLVARDDADVSGGKVSLSVSLASPFHIRSVL